MLAETEALPLGFVAIVPPTDVDLGGPEQVTCRAAVVVGDGCTFPVTVPRSTLRPIHLDRAAGLLETDELFADDLEDVIWNVTTSNFRIAQFRVFELLYD